MGESLTPILTRDQYRKGYLSYLAKENSMNLMNLAANQTFASEGETIGTLYSQSSTVSAIPREQKLAILAMKMQGYLKQPDLTIRQLPNNQLDFLYVGIDTIKQLMGASGVQLPMEDLMFRQYMSQLLVGAKDTASFKAAYGTPTPAVDGEPKPEPFRVAAPSIDTEQSLSGQTSALSGYTADVGSLQSRSYGSFAGLNSASSSDVVSHDQSDAISTVTSFTQPETSDEFDSDSVTGSSGTPSFTTGSSGTPSFTTGSSGTPSFTTGSSGTPSLRSALPPPPGLSPPLRGMSTIDTFGNYIRQQPGGRQILRGINSLFPDSDSEGSGLKSALKKQQRTGKRGPRGRLILGEGLTPLGKHFLDTYDLENHNKVCIRYQGGKLVKAIPAKVVGGTVAGALKSIVKGKAPSALDVEKMTEDERNYLNLISSKAHVKQLQVPSKDKTAEEKLVHKFNTMKGEIIAGNDNKDLIKEFKLLLLKLKQMSKISKDDVNEILMDLVALGY